MTDGRLMAIGDHLLVPVYRMTTFAPQMDSTCGNFAVSLPTGATTAGILRHGMRASLSTLADML